MRALFLAAIVLPLFLAPVSASTYRASSALAKAQSRQSVPVNSTRAGRSAYGMEAPALGSDRNSPEATGGSSLGSTRKLLEY